ncbi:hypothetical protein QA601_04395 [Chitinispirillales bacterium ANBcel5]|uniref:hypothetical protein n=1 Tax=Cellulosispirillum alkaliphilum TaxID=3039283 RepID=UPI002A534F1A|nr:hypothetical protein [Chitinispirillales bacterium ANBcel5]
MRSEVVFWRGTDENDEHQKSGGANRLKNGFSTKEGLIAISGLFGAIIIAIIGFGYRLYLTGLFVSLISLFFITYGKKLSV